MTEKVPSSEVSSSVLKSHLSSLKPTSLTILAAVLIDQLIKSLTLCSPQKLIPVLRPPVQLQASAYHPVPLTTPVSVTVAILVNIVRSILMTVLLLPAPRTATVWTEWSPTHVTVMWALWGRTALVWVSLVSVLERGPLVCVRVSV